MAEGKHTPGPWRYLEDHDGDAAGRALTVCDAANNDLANVYSREDATVDISREEAIANARMIAAAPETAAERDRLKEINAELLATLESINRCTSPGSRTVDELMRDMGLACDIARAAIARATVTP